MFEERRLDPREHLALPIQLAGGPAAITRDISATGLFFTIEGEHVLHGPVHFELHLPAFAMRFSSSGEIVRIEHEGGRTGVAVRFVNPKLDSTQDSTPRQSVSSGDVCPVEIGSTKP